MRRQFLFILLSLVIGINGFYASAYGADRYIFESTWGDLGSAEGAFNNPNGVALSMLGALYVSDMWNHRIQKFTKNGDYIMSWGSQGTGDGQFELPGGLAVNLVGNVYVADRGNHRIEEGAGTATNKNKPLPLACVRRILYNRPH
jgi:DNA-binding beta-propeller fold protein YncE